MGSRSSTTDLPGTPPEDIVIVGTVRRPHGVRGEVTVEVLTDVEGRFAPGRTLWCVPPGRETPVRSLTVVTSRTHKGAALLRFEGYDDRDEVDELRGCDLAVAAADSPPLPEGEWYHHQLLGCRVIDARDGELGTVAGVSEEGGGSMLVLDPPGDESGEILVPFVQAFLRRVSPEDGVIETELPEGLIEACASKS